MPRIKKFGRRKYSSNQHKKSKSSEELLLNPVESASRRKIKIPDLLQEQDSQNVNIIVELDLLSSLMKNLLCCKYCCSSEKIELREDLKSRRGLAVSLEIICHNCGESTSTMSSKISNKCYDVNLRLTYGMRAIGKGGAAARIFCGLMNLPPPPAKFERHNSLFLNVLKTISEDSMNAAVHEAVIANDNNSNIAVAVDGTWHKRGYSSLNGVVCATSVENGKVIDFEALTKYCSSCKGKKKKKKPCENCAKNYEGFSGEWNVGVLSIFQRSESSRKACYTQYLGDGDSKGFLTIKEAKVYGDTEVEKLECVGHVQKRMGTRLRNILKMSKGIKLSDGKNISGRGRLTLKEVDSIQHYYGLAIRKNLSSVEDMKRAICAIYFHKLSTEDNPQHALCPLEKDLLKKCLHGRTQNPNESFNKCIWERIPKTVFVGIETLKFGVMDAVICFNDGYNNVRSDVEKCCRICDPCAARKGPRKRTRGRLQLYNVGAPFRRIAFNILGPLPRSSEGNNILVVMDYFTKWPEAYPIPDQEASTVAEDLAQHWISRFGSDGMVERFNRTILNSLSLLVSSNQQDWDKKFPFFLLAYKSAVYETTGYSPSQMLFERYLRLPADLLFSRPPDAALAPEEYIEKLHARMEEIYHLARERIGTWLLR
ncbi:uncharacterized protein TNCV_443551 [Trichonephila clavipes]|nr:uncharacterized protein TNCV_443551 [Trichonephila clavipes]